MCLPFLCSLLSDGADLKQNKKEKRSRSYTKQDMTRLTYNCAHLRSTKECLTLEYLEKENKSIAEKEEGGKYLKGEIVILQRRRKTGKEKEENIWRKNIFWF